MSYFQSNAPIQCAIAMILYFGVLLGISRYRSRSATLSDYMIGSRNSIWWLVSLGMLSESISAVTYLSVPGSVTTQQYGYLQVVMGYIVGYLFIAYVLIPLYYRHKIISIYSYLGDRFGSTARKTGASIFILSRLFGTSARLYLALIILHNLLIPAGTISPVISFTVAMALIVAYTYKGGIKSIIWTDAFQSIMLLLGIFAVISTVWGLLPNPLEVALKPQMFFWDPLQKNFFFKQFFGGMCLTVAMNGLDQNVMQKSLSCKNGSEAKKNMVWLSVTDSLANGVIVVMGALALEVYRKYQYTLGASDHLVSDLVFQHLSPMVSVFFVLGITGAAFGSGGSVLPPLASSIELDLLPKRWQNRMPVRALHVLVAILMLEIITLLYHFQSDSMINVIYKFAGFTYGPLLGLFLIGIFTKWKLRDRWIPVTAILSCLITALLDRNCVAWFSGYQFGFELIAVNALTFIGLSSLAREAAIR